MFNRVRHFIKNISLNSGLNREKFISNKNKIFVNKYNNNNVKNTNIKNNIIVRKMSTYVQHFDKKCSDNNFNNNNNNNNNDDLILMLIIASYVYILREINHKKKGFKRVLKGFYEINRIKNN